MSGAIVYDCTNADYHRDTTAISHSGLDLVIEDPASYHFRKLSGLYVREETPQHFAEGTALDEALLQTADYCGANVVPVPREVLAANGRRCGAAWDQFAAEHKGKILVEPTAELWQWVKAVQRHPAARALIESDGRYQESILWHDDEHGVKRRSRFDMILDGEDYIVDLKTSRTSASLAECVKEVAKWGYHRQAAFYQDAAEEAYNRRPDFLFIFVSKVAPYRVEVFELDEEFIEIGREQNAHGLKTYAECMASGIWKPRTHGTVSKLSPPRWLRWEKQWS
jgi:hypothetical protein